MASRFSEPKKMEMKLHVNWGHGSTQQPQRGLVDADGETVGLVSSVDEVMQQRDVCRAFDEAPYLPIAATSSASSFSEEL